MHSVIGCRRPEIIFVDKRAKEAKIIDIAIRGDARVKDKELAPVAQTLDSAIHRIKIYPADNAIGFPDTYPLDSDLSGG